MREHLPEPGSQAHDALVERAACARDEGARRAAFNLLVRVHWSEVYRVCAAIAGPAAGDDAAQEAFVRAFRAMTDAPPREFRTWLLTIARNRACDLRRAGSRYLALVRSGADEVPEPSSGWGSPENQVMWQQRVERLRRVLDEQVRNPNQRDAFLMRLNTRLSDAEIGAVLGVSAKAVRSYVCQTRKLLLASLCEA